MRTGFFASIILISVFSYGFCSTDNALTLFEKSLESYRKKDHAESLSAIEAALRLAPNQPTLLYHLARVQSVLGKYEDALETLERALKYGIAPKAEAEQAFSSLRERKEFQDIVRQLTRNGQCLGVGDVAFVVPQRDLILEGIAYDPSDRRFYVGSIYRRKILTIDSKGAVSEFVKEKQDDLWAVLGIKVDPKRRWLWANSANLGAEMNMIDPEPDREGFTAVSKYDLKTGKLIKRYALEQKGDKHGFNDLTLASDGSVYITDSRTGSIYTISPQEDKLKVLVAAGQMSFPNGIALSSDDRHLYIAHVAGISLLDLQAGKVQTVSAPDFVALNSIDGMVYYEDSLVAVQGLVGVDRIIRFYFSTDPARIDRAEIYHQNHPLYALPTTGTIADDSFYFIANSQLRSFDEKGKIFTPEKLQPYYIMKVKLRAQADAVDLEKEKAELLRIHREDRRIHFETDVPSLLSGGSEDFISVSSGKISRPTKAEQEKMFTRYFDRAKYFEWDDLEPPIIRISDDATMAWMIVRLKVRRTQPDSTGKESEQNFVYAGIMIYEKKDGKWIRTANVSTFE